MPRGGHAALDTTSRGWQGGCVLSDAPWPSRASCATATCPDWPEPRQDRQGVRGTGSLASRQAESGLPGREVTVGHCVDKVGLEAEPGRLGRGWVFSEAPGPFLRTPEPESAPIPGGPG